MGAKNKRLVGIKAIADYLDTSERNVYRWQKELGLPIRKIAGSKGRSAYAYVEELEEWMRNQKYVPPDKSKERSKIVKRRIIISISVIIFIFLLVQVSRKINWKTLTITKTKDFSNPVTASLEGDMIHIKDQKGEMLWPYRVMADDMDPGIKKWDHNRYIDILDIDKDGANEIASRKYEGYEGKYCLLLYDNDGSILWKKNICNDQEFKGVKFTSSFIPFCIKFAHSNNHDPYIVAYWRHAARFISLISCHNSKGKLMGKYIHAGNLVSLEIFDLNNDGIDEIVFSGTNNLLNGEGVLGVLNLTGFKGVSPPYVIEPEYSHLSHLESYIPDEPEFGNQIIYIRFKQTSHLKEHHSSPFTFARLDDIDVNSVHVILKPWHLKSANVSIGFEYVFDNSFNLLDLVPDAPLRMHYPSLQENKEIGIPLQEILNIYNSNVLSWEDGRWIHVNH